MVPAAYRLAHDHAAGRIAAGAGQRANRLPDQAACGGALGEMTGRAVFPPSKFSLLFGCYRRFNSLIP